MRWLRVTLVGLLLGLACAAVAVELWPAREEVGVPLYFSMQVRQGGQIVARPQLVGASGHGLLEVLRLRDGTPRLQLHISPTLRGDEVGIDLHLDLPNERGLGKSFVLLHGQQANVRLSHDVQVTILAMKVHSPEFVAYIEHAPIFESSQRAGG